KGATESGYPKVYTAQYCESNGPLETGVSAQISNSKNSHNGEESTFQLTFDIDFTLVEHFTTMDGGICIVVETMDPLSPVIPDRPCLKSRTLTVGDNIYTPELSTERGVPEFDCPTCKLPPAS
ncbi:MAG: hypothetical protein AAF570_11570, partial [Bacteroidota bacterium]